MQEDQQEPVAGVGLETVVCFRSAVVAFRLGFIPGHDEEMAAVFDEDAVLLDLLFEVENFAFTASKRTWIMLPLAVMIELMDDVDRRSPCQCMIMAKSQGVWRPEHLWPKGKFHVA